ncbi:HNH endonuclease [Acidithiobacillus ferrooxidans]|uniref:HNH endonuclease n=1 Tax=Acidithiobacillus ferrooxidans TaxID=920 RepID=UPI0021498F52|nr:HNH endonuclease [Acidithiobacillus ferrooxidans]MCR1346269.1 HNH endonuclease [Acidithiobacillus ferrooxidans]MCR1355298.1 HNH endonuclease [Acidithiobacillus ferrooxidans]
MADILRLDSAGNPLHWIGQEEAAGYYAKGMVVWTLGEPFRILHGGRNRFTGLQSHMDIHPVISVRGTPWTKWRVPALTNAALFRRDGHLCMYCGRPFKDHDLTRDHIIPTSKGGKDSWTNVVCACKRCNIFKGSRDLEETKLKLRAVPYTPNWHEFLCLTGRRILADQMEFLRAGFHHLQA